MRRPLEAKAYHSGKRVVEQVDDAVAGDAVLGRLEDQGAKLVDERGADVDDGIDEREDEAGVARDGADEGHVGGDELADVLGDGVAAEESEDIRLLDVEVDVGLGDDRVVAVVLVEQQQRVGGGSAAVELGEGQLDAGDELVAVVGVRAGQRGGDAEHERRGAGQGQIGTAGGELERRIGGVGVGAVVGHRVHPRLVHALVAAREGRADRADVSVGAGVDGA